MTVSPSSRIDVDADLVEALRRDDPDAAERLVERFGNRVYRLARRITGSNEDAEEVAQDALWTAARQHVQGRVGLRQLALPHRRQRRKRESARAIQQGPRGGAGRRAARVRR